MNTIRNSGCHDLMYHSIHQAWVFWACCRFVCTRIGYCDGSIHRRENVYFKSQYNASLYSIENKLNYKILMISLNKNPATTSINQSRILPQILLNFLLQWSRAKIIASDMFSIRIINTFGISTEQTYSRTQRRRCQRNSR